ncbi:hypothetical protein UCD39_09900 [Nitrospirillum sp. BR 11752]|uniref:hypothetical protein n=1 Tax=Nitrospirillum sp. BR 11752 TaxID=3104293 RepID=UPI002EC06EE3|nr:hypothetical protein [Nitrospirillum sp. BR 11752]
MAGLFASLFMAFVIVLNFPHAQAAWVKLCMVAFAAWGIHGLRVFRPGWLKLLIDADGVTLIQGRKIAVCAWDDAVMMMRVMGNKSQAAGIFIQRRGDAVADHGCFDKSWFFIPDDFALNRTALSDLLRRYHDQGGRLPLPPEPEPIRFTKDAKTAWNVGLLVAGALIAPILALVALLVLRH